MELRHNTAHKAKLLAIPLQIAGILTLDDKTLAQKESIWGTPAVYAMQQDTHGGDIR